MNKNRTFVVPFLLMVFLVIGLLLGSLLNRNSFEPTSGTYDSKMDQILSIIDSKYVDDVKKDELYEQSINDMLHKLDPHSNYIPAKDLVAVNEEIDGEFGGIGIRFAIIRDTLCVTNVVQGSPSNVAGVKAGDKIIAINGKSVAKKKMKNEQFMKLLKGKPNTQVTVTLYRKKAKINKSIIRGVIPIPSIVCAQMIDNKTGFIRLEQFSVNSAEEFHDAVLRLQAKGMKKLIFDLRDNPGGVLGDAVQIADEFLPAGAKIVEVKGKKTENNLYRASKTGLLEKTEAVILINENSASASEIVAGALQDNDRATIIGRRSFGKGLVQQDFLLADHSDLRLTIARYYTPSGRCIQRSFKEGFENYYHDRQVRQDNGEYFAIDSSIFKNAPKYKTNKGRTVYGGGGIMPDYFVPLDTSNSTVYYVELRYSGAFQQYAFDFVSNKRAQWSSIQVFNKAFEPSEAVINQLAAYAAQELGLSINQRELTKSKSLIKTALKAEIARQLFIEEGYFFVIASKDREMQKALQLLK